ncbi:hypothetical protein MRX96_042469, partial [Rhipicephalus microplus]
FSSHCTLQQRGHLSGSSYWLSSFSLANGKGSAVAALGVFVLQIWQTTGRFLSRITPARMTYGLDRCPGNYTLHEEASNGNREHADALLLYRISSYWFSLLTVCLTVVLGLTFSLLCPSSTNEIRDAARLSSPPMFKFWRRVGLLRHVSKEHRETSEMVHNNAALEVRPLQTTKEDDNLTSAHGNVDDIVLQPMLLGRRSEDRITLHGRKATINYTENS